MVGIPAELIEEAEKPEEFDGIYPDNFLSVSIFLDLLTQWRTGMSGVTGLDYNAIPAVLNLRKVKSKDREEVFECVKVMESAVLNRLRTLKESK